MPLGCPLSNNANPNGHTGNGGATNNNIGINPDPNTNGNPNPNATLGINETICSQTSRTYESKHATIEVLQTPTTSFLL